MSSDTVTTDRLEIADLFTRLALLLDDRRWDDAGTVYTGDATVLSPRGGELRGVDALAGFLRGTLTEGERTQHLTTDILVDVHGDRAVASANSLVHFYRDGRAPHRTGGLRLEHTAVRTPAGWRFDEARITPGWIRED